MELEAHRVIKALKVNREQHAQRVLFALQGYREELAEVCRHIARSAQRHADSGEGWWDPGLLADRILAVPLPVSYDADYDSAITRLEMQQGFEVGVKVDLDESQFEAWVMDNWAWSRAHNQVFDHYQPKLSS